MKYGYNEFTSHNAEILAIGPNGPEEFRRYWTREQIPYVGLPDPDHQVARMYRQEVNLFKLGRMPLNCIVDPAGRMRYVHYGSSMADIPENEVFLNVIDQMNESSS